MLRRQVSSSGTTGLDGFQVGDAFMMHQRVPPYQEERGLCVEILVMIPPTCPGPVRDGSRCLLRVKT